VGSCRPNATRNARRCIRYNLIKIYYYNLCLSSTQERRRSTGATCAIARSAARGCWSTRSATHCGRESQSGAFRPCARA
jgi:hypothetical protein